MEPENLGQISSFGIAAAKYMGVLCVVLWLCLTMLELTEKQSLQKSGFYRGVFWIIYLFLALVCGQFLEIISINESKKLTILTVLLVLALVIANWICRYLEITARKTADIFQDLRTRIKKNGRF